MDPKIQVTSYAHGVKNNKMINGHVLEYDAPSKEEIGSGVVFIDEELDEEVGKWKISVVVYIVGAKHMFGIVETVLGKLWKEIASPVFHPYVNGHLIARFQSEEECYRILELRPLAMKNRHVILRKWRVGVEFWELKDHHRFRLG